MPGSRGHQGADIGQRFGGLAVAPGVIRRYQHQAAQAAQHEQIRGFSPFHFYAPHADPYPPHQLQKFGHLQVGPKVRWPWRR